MTNPFPKDLCPLCGMKVVSTITDLSRDDSYDDYICSSGKSEKDAHYKLLSSYARNAKVSEQEMYQHVLISPFLFETAIYDDPELTYVYHQDHIFFKTSLEKIAIKLPRITDWSNPNKLIERVKILITFS